MATIREREAADGTVTFHVQVRLKGFKPATASFERKTDAKKWAGATETAMREGRYFSREQGAKRTLAELLDRYETEVLADKADKATQAPQLKWWRRELGHVVLRDLAPGVIGAARDKLMAEPGSKGKPRGPATANRYLAALSHALSVASKEWEWIEANPLKRVRRKVEPRGRVRFLSDAERKRVLEACKASDEKTLFPITAIAIASGPRQGEILALRYPEHVDLVKRRLLIARSKNGESRTVPIAPFVVDALREYLKGRGAEPGLLFPIRGDVLHKPWREALAAAKVEDFRFHDLRHTAASYLAMNGATLMELMHVLGHKTMQMVKRYAHLTEQHTAEVVDRMAAKVFGEPKTRSLTTRKRHALPT